jgi:menaquinone-9 beta-reductase
LTRGIQRYDVAIVGAGPAGAATAIHLTRSGVQVVLIDRAVFPRDKACAEYLSPAAEPLLAELGVLEEIEATRPSRLRGFRVFAPDGSEFQADFAATRDATGRSLFETGLAVPRKRLDSALVGAAQRDGAELSEGWKLGQIERHADQGSSEYVLTPAPGTGDGEPVHARLVVAADGLHSTVARRLGLHMPSRMRKVALVAHMRGIVGLGAYGEMHVAHRRYVGLAPLEPASVGDLCNVAMVVDEARDGRKLAGRAQAFLLDALETFPRLRGRVARVQVTRATLTTSRLCVRVRRLSDAGLLLVGDASGYYDPFTGEGIYRALRGAQLAAQVTAEALASNDLSAAALARYDRLAEAEYRGKRMVEALVQSAVQFPPFMNHVAAIMRQRKSLADTLLGVTGDFVSPSAVLRPGYLARLIV